MSSAGSSACSIAVSACGTDRLRLAIGRQAAARCSLVVLCIYGGLLVSDLAGCSPGTDRVSFRSRTRAAHRQRATARLGLAASERGRHGAESRRSPATTPGVAHTITVSGMSFLLQANSSEFRARCSSSSKPFDERRSPELQRHGDHGQAAEAMGRRGQGRQVTVFGAPPIPGLGVAGGFKLMVEDRGGLGLDELAATDRRPDRQAASNPALIGVSTQFRSNTPQLFMDIDRTKVARWACPSTTSIRRCEIYLGSLYVNSFNAFGRHWQVNIQADGRLPPSRSRTCNLLQGPQPTGPDGSAGDAGRPARDRRPGHRHALQPVHGRADHRQPAAGRQPGEAIDDSRRLADDIVAALDEDRMDRADVHANPGRQHGACMFSPWP